jgi:hypothetical protein
MTTAEIREKYLSFFESKGCKRLPSSSLIPDDPSLLLTSAGMVQFKPYFLHVKEFDPAYIGATTSQKCVRTNDIDIIGTTGRHLSFFEMLGNFSFGRYFKKEMCTWAYEFSTEVLKLPKEKLYFTVYLDDDETIEIWKSLGVPDDHISRLGEEDNFWRAGPTGPCGPCSEIYYDQGPSFSCGKPDCKVGCDCDRYLEFWNCVFTQFDGQEDGTLAPLPTKNIDTGMGLERMAAIMQGVQSNYDTDVMRDLVRVGETLSGKAYHSAPAVDLSLRIIADHSRSVSFMIADGILPSNEGRGYVLRRLLRRAVLHGHKLGIQGPFLSNYVAKIVELMGDVYPEIVDNRELVERVMLSEEQRFGTTLRQGQHYLQEALTSQVDDGVLPGEIAFTLHDTYGFPFELTREIAAEAGVRVDEQEFKACMEQQRTRAREANTKDAEAAWSTYGGVHAELLKRVGASQFVGHEQLEAQARIVALIKDGAIVDVLSEGEQGEVVLDVTPFYAEMGGEVGDTGTLSTAASLARVTDTQAPEKGLICHSVTVERGAFRAQDIIQAQVDGLRRKRIARNHTATHLLHAALREVLGEHVNQAGSYVGPDRLRFDFTHFQALTKEEMLQVEARVNDVIGQAIPLTVCETSLEEARKSGAMALFGEKYGEKVRVVSAGEFSKELCGGCHCNNTSDVNYMKLISQSSVGANVRRVEALTSFDAFNYAAQHIAALDDAAAMLKCQPLALTEKLNQLLAEVKEAQTTLKTLKAQAQAKSADSLLDNQEISAAGYPVIFGTCSDADAGALRTSWDMLRQKMKTPGAVLLAGTNNGKVTLLAAASDEAVDAGFDAGALIRAIAVHVQGGGGGKKNMAQAGGSNVNGIDAAFDAAREVLGCRHA